MGTASRTRPQDYIPKAEVAFPIRNIPAEMALQHNAVHFL
jgi:hypothetical protein